MTIIITNIIIYLIISLIVYISLILYLFFDSGIISFINDIVFIIDDSIVVKLYLDLPLCVPTLYKFFILQ